MGKAEREQAYLIHLLSSVLRAREPQSPPPDLDWDLLYRLAAWHQVANMVTYGLSQLPAEEQPVAEIMRQFLSDRQRGIAKEATQQVVIEQLLSSFEENGIACLPLKGYLLKHLYPQPDMRLLTDVDILVRPEQTAQVQRLLLARGFSLQHAGGNHDVYHRRPFMNIEVHRRLVSDSSPYYSYLQIVWQRTQPETDCRFICRLSPEDFFIYLLIHLAKHFSNGGTGIRSIMDVWVYQSYYGANLDRGYLRAELQELSLQDFAQNMLSLAAVWFGGASSCQLLDELADYLWVSGVYGVKLHSVVLALPASSDAGNSKRLLWLNLFFPGLSHMRALYPVLSKLPSFLPIFWVLRGFRCLLFRRQAGVQTVRELHSLTTDATAKMLSLHERVGLPRGRVKQR